MGHTIHVTSSWVWRNYILMLWFKSRAHKIPLHSFELEENMCALHGAGAEMKMFRLLPPQLLKSMAQKLCLLSVNLKKTLVFSLAFCRTINVSCYKLNSFHKSIIGSHCCCRLGE
ncbi:hypothetical protein IGI04_001282 [Brassica rapa subsp. trilocularis]|uniref:F-box domain-containing protein n=1 Tax=Brassica rapa subsp. trilocularis TaxID=1813537 RepID=A0ABQ7NS83_BRACM|nr:hypothetical protein IGI04_001282 [Brassica rapa subsp. trilocularis]